jgi:hypothetical protein
MRWENHMDLEGVAIMVRAHVENALEAGAEIILADSLTLVPHDPPLTGALAASASIKKSRGGVNTVGIVYDSVYAGYVHEHLLFKHPYGGGAKYLEIAMIAKGQDAINKAGKYIWDKVTARKWGSL